MLWYAQAQPTMDVTLNMLLTTPSGNHSAWSTFLLLKRNEKRLWMSLYMVYISITKEFEKKLWMSL